MQPKNFYFGGGPAGTMIHPAVLVAMILTVILTLLLPRKYVIVPFLFLVFLTPSEQTVVVGGVHFFVYRILLLAGWIRLLGTRISSPGGLYQGRLGLLDKLFAFWALFRVLALILRFSFQTNILFTQAGFLLDAFGGYFLLRYLIQDEEDVVRVIKVLAVIATIVGMAMLGEKITQQNLFGYLGGVPIQPGFREGAYRCQGPFKISILAGCFGATLLPLFIWLWKSGKSKALAATALIAATIIVITSASSTPLLAFLGVIMAVCFWPFRRQMRLIRWGIVIALIGLQIVMKAPVWFFITHFTFIEGSSNYHRAMLIDEFVRHFSDWWLIGTSDNGNWGWDFWDQANQFVAEGESGGLATLICFIAIISVCFSWLGKARKFVDGDRAREWFLWLLGVALFAHIVAFFGIDYFDQSQVGWYVLLAMIVTVTSGMLTQPAEEAEPVVAAMPLLKPGTTKPEFARRTLARR